MKFTLRVKLVVIALSTIASVQARAGGCVLKEVTPSKELLAQYLANEIRDKVIKIEAEMNRKGQQLKAVMIARSGESLSKFDVVGDDLTQPLQAYLDQVAAAADANRPDNKSARIPKEYLVKNEMAYSHFGFLLKQNPHVKTLPGEKVKDWMYITHLLAECDETSKRYGDSDIFFATFNQFFWDTKFLDKKNAANKALIVVPTPEIQEGIYQITQNAEIGNKGLHTLKYNVAAVPFNLRPLKKHDKAAPEYYQLDDQNSNQWPLEVIAASTRPIGEVKNRMDAQDILMQTNYHPRILHPRGLKESLACSMTKGKILFVNLWDATNLINCKDQVFRPQGIVQLITVDSVVDYMAQTNLLAENVDYPGRIGTYEIIASKQVLEELDAKGKIIENVQKRAALKAEEREKKNGTKHPGQGLN